MTVDDFWQQCLSLLGQSVPEKHRQRWLEPLSVADSGREWVVYAHNNFTFGHIRRHFWGRIMAARDEIIGDADAPILVLKVGTCPLPVSQEATASLQPTIFPSNTADVLTEATGAGGKAAPVQPESDAAANVAKRPRKERTGARETAQDIIARRLQQTGAAPASDGDTERETGDLPPVATGLTGSAQKTPDQAVPEGSGGAAETDSGQRHYRETNLNPEHTFATLVQGKGNRIAYAAGVSVAEEPGNSMYNPLFVYGSTGLGKTHLVQAVGNKLFSGNSRLRIRYFHGEEFVRSIMNAFRSKSFDAMRRQYQQTDLLILDDVQFIAGKERTMEEFFYVYNHLIDTKKQVILTGDTLPTHIDGMDERLKSRFSWGLTLELEPPELEMRVAILQKKAEQAGVQMDEEAAFFIAKHIRSNVRELEGAFKRVAAQSRFAGRRIDVGLATEALQDVLTVHHKPMTLEHIQSAVAKYYGITISDMMSPKRTRNLTRPRQMAMTLAKELTDYSLPVIGAGFGGRDHTTVMHAVKSVVKLKKTDADTAKAYDTLMLILRD